MNYRNLIIRGIKELVLTWSSKQSLLSSKKVERFVVVTNMLLLTDAYVLYRVFMSSTDFAAFDFMLIIGGWVTYGGYSMKQSQKDSQTPPTI